MAPQRPVPDYDPPKPSPGSALGSQEVFRAIETLIDYSLFTNSGEIGNLAAKMSLMVKNQHLPSKKQKQITDFLKCELEERFIHILCSIAFVTSLNSPDKSD